MGLLSQLSSEDGEEEEKQRPWSLSLCSYSGAGVDVEFLPCVYTCLHTRTHATHTQTHGALGRKLRATERAVLWTLKLPPTLDRDPFS